MKKPVMVMIVFAIFMMCTAVYAQDDVTTVYGDKTMYELYEYFYKTDKPAVIAEQRNASVTSTRLYDQLTDIEKDIYDGIEAQIMNTFNGKDNIECKLSKKIYLGQDYGDVQTAITNKLMEETGLPTISYVFFRPYYAFFSLDHPEYFWVDDTRIGYAYSYTEPSGGYTTVTVKYVISKDKSGTPLYDTYLPDIYNDDPAAARKEYEKAMAKADEIVASAPKGSSIWGKLNYYMLWLKDNCKYNEYLDSGTLTKRSRLAVSALLYGDKGKDAPVCEGYSEALKILCDKSGIDSMCVQSQTHKWNLIKINNKFYHCDPTWFDSMYVDEEGNPVKPFGLISYDFLLVGSDTMGFQDVSTSHNMLYQDGLFLSPDVSKNDYLKDMGITVDYQYSDDPEYNYEGIKYGKLDTDMDESITKNDSLALLKIISGIAKGTAKDVNGDGKTDLNDVVKMQKLMFG